MYVPFATLAIVLWHSRTNVLNCIDRTSTHPRISPSFLVTARLSEHSRCSLCFSEQRNERELFLILCLILRLHHVQVVAREMRLKIALLCICIWGRAAKRFVGVPLREGRTHSLLCTTSMEANKLASYFHWRCVFRLRLIISLSLSLCPPPPPHPLPDMILFAPRAAADLR